MKLRPYQRRLIDVTKEHLHAYPDSTPLIVAPTASGKSVIVAELCLELARIANGMIIVLTHRKELVSQNASKLPESLGAGVFSAGLGKKQLRRITVAGFQSIRKHAATLPKVSYIIIDEAQYAMKGYREFINTVKLNSPKVRVIGLTATPFLGDANRTALHLLPADKAIFTGIGAEVSMTELLRDGYLTPLIPYDSSMTKLKTDGIKIDTRTGDFALKQLQDAVDTDDLNTKVAAEISSIFAERNSVLVFCTGVEHAYHIRDALRRLGHRADAVLGETPGPERDKIITRFKDSKLKFLVACEVLLVGFDAPCCDGIANLRPSKSALIWVQLNGRGMRLFPGKQNCLVADFSDTSVEMGPINEIEGRPPKTGGGQAPIKVCEECFSIILAGLRTCPVCGHEFIFHAHAPEEHFDATTGLLISNVIKNDDGTKTYPVSSVEYKIQATRTGAPAVVAEYFTHGRKSPVATDYYNLWHHSKGAVERDAARWLRRQASSGGSVPLTAEEALARAEMGALMVPKVVTVKPGSPFPVRYT